jgi:hypothetical protein
MVPMLSAAYAVWALPARDADDTDLRMRNALAWH